MARSGKRDISHNKKCAALGNEGVVRFSPGIYFVSEIKIKFMKTAGSNL